MKSETIHFVSDLFENEHGEIPPQLACGKKLALSISRLYENTEFNIQNVVLEDNIWKVNIQKKPFALWIECEGALGVDFSEDYFEENEQGVTWSCCLVMESGISQNFIQRRKSTNFFLEVSEILKGWLYMNQDIDIVKEEWH